MQFLRAVAAFSFLAGGLFASEFKLGDRVDAQSSGAWYPAKVIEAGEDKWKVHYVGYGSNYDEWLGADRLRAAPVPPKPLEKVVEKPPFPVLPEGKIAGIEGAFLRIQTYFWGSSLSFTNEGWFLTKEGRFSKAPEGGFDFMALKTAREAGKNEGVYWIEGGQIVFMWSDGSKPERTDVSDTEGKIRWSGRASTRVKAFEKGWRLEGEYEGGASIGGGASSNKIVFRADGTFARASVASVSSTGETTEVSARAQSAAEGSYEFESHTLTFKMNDGTLLRSTVFAYGDVDRAGLPEYIYRDGTLMKHQNPRR